MGGEAVANLRQRGRLGRRQAAHRFGVEAFGDLHVLVNNAGILRDKMLVNMSEEDWDSVIHVHLKGHFAPTRHAAAYWREQVKAGHEVHASVVNTSSTSGLLGNPGQTNYGAAKAGIAAFTVIAAQELSRYGVRVNAIAPAARTRMTEQTPGLGDIVKAPEDPARSTCGTRPTSLPSSRISRRSRVRSTVRCSSFKAERCASCGVGR